METVENRFKNTLLRYKIIDTVPECAETLFKAEFCGNMRPTLASVYLTVIAKCHRLRFNAAVTATLKDPDQYDHPLPNIYATAEKILCPEPTLAPDLSELDEAYGLLYKTKEDVYSCMCAFLRIEKKY